MTVTIPSSTHSTNKANSVLARRRERRRNLESNQTSNPLLENGEETNLNLPSTEAEAEPFEKEEPAQAAPATVTPIAQRRQDQEKANNYLAQRRARRRRARELQSPPELEATPPSVEKNSQITMAEPQRLIVLMSEGVSDRTQASNQSRALNLLEAKKIPHIAVDGMDPAQRERRNELFTISGIRANYPQFFLEQKDGTTVFVGDWEVIEGINDSSALPAETIEAHPDLLTWDRVFGNLVVSFDE